MKLHREMMWAEEESIKSQIGSYFIFSKIAESLENVLPEFLTLSHKRLKGYFCHPEFNFQTHKKSEMLHKSTN